ncbi:MAG: pyridoxamine 5'-phosphate oxidase family protein [Gemmatimonadota bacterium]
MSRVDPPSSGRTFATRELTASEIQAVLERSWWGNLATVSGGEPYAVPVVYGYDGRWFWVASGTGKKIECLENNPAVCLTVVEVIGDGEDWASVVVTGRGDLVRDPRSHLAALRALRRQRGHMGPVGPRDALRLARARVIRITPREITGRAKG